AAIASAQAELWRRARVATEPGGATAYAALAAGAWRARDGERVGVLVCGANVDPRALADTLDAHPG
ncbi:MAG: threonine/serine dehydratase, partial [Burkholderiaceae bacterium]